LRVRPMDTISGEITVPGDKSISHRAVMLGAMARGTTVVKGFLMGEDCLSTVSCFRQLGVPVEIKEDTVIITGCGGQLQSPDAVLDAGNSGTTVRLLMGILAASPGLSAVLDGDNSLAHRPMGRVMTPLIRMGAQFASREDNYLPISVSGRQLWGISYSSPVASAQVKSAVLLAGLSAGGDTEITEPFRSRDHTERMLKAFGAKLESHGTTVALTGGQALHGCQVKVPGDISSAAFFITAALTAKEGSLGIKNVGINHTRSGIIDALREMGADIRLNNRRMSGYEEVADLHIESSDLRGAVFGGDLIPRMIDEIPALAVAALAARGSTVIKDAAELRVKESDRIEVLVKELRRMGADISERPDGLEIRGGRRLNGTAVSGYGDHRMAMALAVAGLMADGETLVKDAESVTVSFPNFWDMLALVSA